MDDLIKSRDDGRKPEVPPLVDLQRHEVSARVICDPEVYRLERERFWPTIWVLLGHDSEIPNPGDFVSRYIGEDVVIVTRDGKGEIQVLLNSCTHRGMAVCRADMGHVGAFVCPYHGWTFGLDGRLRGMPVANQKLGGDLVDKSELGLKRARVGVHVGMIFATFDENAPTLAEWLGEAAWYLTLNYGRTERGMEVLGPPQRWTIEGNWKLAAEQFVGSDSYHVYTLHRSMFEMEVIGRMADITPQNAPAGDGVNVSFPQGHSFRCAENPILAKRGKGSSSRERLLAFPPPGATPEIVEEICARFDADQLKILADMPPDAPEQLKQRIAETAPMMVGPTGMIEADDGECWPFMQRAAQGGIASQGITGTIKYHALVGEKRTG